MTDEIIVAALVPARKGSVGVPGKNILPIKGRSLVERALLCAFAVPSVKNNIYVSTDDVEARQQALALGVKTIERPPDLAHGTTPMIKVVLHALKHMDPDPDFLVLLQPTTPTRTWEMVHDAVTMLVRNPKVDSVVSVVPLPLSHSPELTMTIRGHDLQFFMPGRVPVARQLADRAFIRDGSVYATRVTSLRKYGSIYGAICRPYMLKPEESLNIDTPEQWERAHEVLS